MPELGDTSKNTLSLRSNYAVIHQRAAVHAARAARSVEEANNTSEFGAWFDEVMIHVPVAVVMAAAALEANANEIIQDILDRSPSSPRRTLLKDLLDKRAGGVMENIAGSPFNSTNFKVVLLGEMLISWFASGIFLCILNRPGITPRVSTKTVNWRNSWLNVYLASRLLRVACCRTDF